MQIALCEDNAADARLLQEYIEQVMAEDGYTARVTRFESGEAFLRAYDAGEAFSILFFDVYMGGMTGVDAASAVRARGGEMPIIFTTTSADFAVEGFRLGAAHYIIKPVRLDDVRQALERCEGVLRNQARRIEVKTEGKTPRSLLVGDIHYAEVYDKLCVLHMAAGDVETRLSLAELEALLDGDEGFVRCHRSYLVNLRHVRGIDGGDFVMEDGRRAAIAQRDAARVRKAYGDYLFNQTRGGGV